MTKTNKPKLWTIVAERELSSYFSSPIPYIVCVIFLLISGFRFFSTFFLIGRAELRNFFQFLPYLFSLFIPALTMRIFSEEKRSGSIETLLTLPVTPGQVVAGKYIAALISGLILLVPTIFYLLACYVLGQPVPGPVIGGYLGSVFLTGAFCAIGLFASASTKNQIVAFFISFAICAALSFVSTFSILMPSAVLPIINFLSAASHFESISRGIIDSRDVIYFVSVTALFLALTVNTIQNSRKG